MKILGVIPARYDSQRLPGKPLADICGKSLILRVYEQAVKAESPTKIIVATDDERIQLECRMAGAECVMTSKSHPSGTDRIAEVMRANEDFDVFVNIQGDMPFIPPKYIDMLCNAFQNSDVSIATLVTRADDEKLLQSPASIKVVRDHQGFALYFSRSVIPFARSEKPRYLRHIGIYAYTRDALSKISKLPPSSLELAESLEQLRWLENGMKIYAIEAPEDTPSIDTADDLIFAREYAANFMAPSSPATP